MEMDREVLEFLQRPYAIECLRILSRNETFVAWNEVKKELPLSDGTYRKRMRELCELRLAEGRQVTREGTYARRFVYRLTDKGRKRILQTLEALMGELE